ncbi:type I restriction endonuclease subunit R [Pelagicoccus albus]|uniref:Type I restriction enzyme endonuclease subunit n=1 Tax=Pelagicoccus albus TaxID=415222 RepID=A0A7X1B648_9BACT|nr:type I restriction endonuclease subunit R [Pelagicoccus albus]MBC2606084.1 type I restriction endonuclease subunit R [Pelagicoccus albus]
MSPEAPKFQEEYSAKLPALTLLHNLGWTFLPPDEALAGRGGKLDEVVLRSELKRQLSKRRFVFMGHEHALSEKSVDNLVAEICSPALNEGLKAANERIYNHLLYGIPVTEFIDGRKATPTIPIIDWKNLDKNSFLFTEEMKVLRSGGVETRRPDIVCFVNGIPLVVIEAKRPDGNAKKGPTIDEGISQSLRNQRIDEIPQLFAYTQLILSINGLEGRYGTQGTKQKFWSAWREEDLLDTDMAVIKNRVISEEALDLLFVHRQPADRMWYESLVAGGHLAVTGQDRILIGLLQPERLLEFARFFVFFDQKAGKVVARYQQVFGIKRLLERVQQKTPKGKRQGGVIWHTTGSGKSFTMVFLSKALILHDALKQCRLLVVTDRVDLEKQLSKTFMTGGELGTKKDKEAAMATSGRRLAEQIGRGTERIIFSLIQKFNTAAKLPECRNDSSDIIVLVDEGHRSQGGENNIRMQQALPNASFIAFTGTPLLKDDKTTNKFGPIVHAYTMQRAVEDKAVTPLLYEERIPDLDVNERAIDAWFDRITEGLTDQQKTDLKKKYAKKGQIYQSEDRIRLIALDIANHFVKNVQDGLKAQLACDSKVSAILYKQYLDETNLFESAVVMSPPDTREGNTEVDEEKAPLVAKWWKENVGSQDGDDYTEAVVKRFEKDPDLKLLIVVSKLLTGFDEPLNSVLYIDKPLEEHNLLQAIARVNRLHPDKKFGYLIDYRGILKELDTTIAKYQDLANRTQGGYDIKDLDGLYNQMSTEYKRLPRLYRKLWDIFKAVANKQDLEALRQVLVPKMEEVEGEMVDANLQVREDFFEALTEFSSCLKVALQSVTFYEDKSFTDADRAKYKEAVKQFSSLRQIAKQDAGQTIDYDEYSESVRKLMDKHVVGVEVKEPKGFYSVDKLGKRENPEDWTKEKTRNETDIIRTRVTRMIEVDLRDDPYAQESFSKLLRRVIEEAERQFDNPMKQYLLFHDFEEQVQKRELSDIPDELAGRNHAQAFFGIFKKELPNALNSVEPSGLQKWIELALRIEQIAEKAIAENSISPQNIEAQIRKETLLATFGRCKEVGAGLDQANRISEWVVQITRAGFTAS